jgi:glycosyltransferase involved in cell wall biosynthesis
MYRGHTIAAVVPAYNEEQLIGRVIETMPDWVDRIVVVDDCSRDGTCDAANGSLIVAEVSEVRTGLHDRE